MKLSSAPEDELFPAARAGDVSRVQQLLARPGADANVRNFVRDTPLVAAAHGGHVAVVRALLRAGADPNAAVSFGAGPLAVACERGDVQVVRALLAAGARVDHANSWGATVIHAAVASGRVEVVEALLAAGADADARDRTGATPLHEARARGHHEIARVLRDHRDHGKATLSVAAFLSAVESGVVDAVERGVERLGVVASAEARDAQGRTAVEIAIACGRVDVVRVLVATGVVSATFANGETSDDRRTVLHRAVLTANDAMVQALLPGVPSEAIDAFDVAGWTALHLAVRARSAGIVATLCRQGANVNLLTTGRRGDPATRYEASALHLAIRSDDTSILQQLLAWPGIELDVKNDTGRTPLVYAVSLDRVEAATRLLNAGADVNVVADAGESALLIAVFRGCHEIAHALLRHGARADVAARSGKTPLTVTKSPEMREVLQLYTNSQQFHDKCFAYLSPQGEAPTLAKLKELVPLITSVYDLRHLLTLVAMCDPAPNNAMETRKLLNQAFLHVVEHKLTFDDKACVFFKLSLERCERDKLLPREDFLLLDRKAEKVNTESAEWVMEMKKQVYANSWRLDNHDQHLQAVTSGLKQVHAMVMENRKALVKVTRRVGSVQKHVQDGKKLVAQLAKRVNRATTQVDRFESRLKRSEENIRKVASSLQDFKQAYVTEKEQEERRQKIKRVCGIVAAVTGFVFAPALKELADAVVDFINPVEIVTKVIGEHDIVGFLAEQSSQVLPEEIKDQLVKLAIPQDEFEALLREEIVLQHPEYLDEAAQRGLAVIVDGGRADIARALEPELHAEEETVLAIINELQALDSVSRSEESDKSSSRTTTTTKAPRSHPNSPVRPVAKHCDGNAAIDAHRRSLDQSAQQRHSTPGRPKAFRSTQVSRRPDTSKTPVSRQRESPTNEEEQTVTFVDDLMDFPTHAAVHETHGNLHKFIDFLQTINAQMNDPNTRMRMRVRSVIRSRETLCAAAFAYRRGYRAVGDWLASLTTSATVIDTFTALSMEILEDLDNLPLILAVEESGGDLDGCKHLVEALMELTDAHDHALDETVEVEVEHVGTVGVEWTAVEYASHLGYEDVVRFMLKELYKTSIPMKTKFQLIKTAHERAGLLAAPNTSPSA